MRVGCQPGQISGKLKIEKVDRTATASRKFSSQRRLADLTGPQKTDHGIGSETLLQRVQVKASVPHQSRIIP